MRPELVVLADPAAVAAECAARVVAAAKGRDLALALAGGGTPKAAYHLLSGSLAEQVDWSRVSLYFGDERCVPPTHPDSNYRMAKEALLDPLATSGKAPRNVERMLGELDPEEAARRYAEHLPARGLDLVLLGMGPDGHTASLFPGSSALGERGRAVAATLVPRLGVYRVTLTYPTLAAARAIVVMVTGAEKAASLALAVDGPPGSVPLRDLRPTEGSMTILCDRAAAAQLST